MSTILVFDKPMCCSTGVCGPQVDPVLPQFAADLDWLKGQGHSVERYNLAQQPNAFIENKAIHQLITTQQTGCLPVVMVDDRIVSQSEYPSREKLAQWAGEEAPSNMFPVIDKGGNCCGGTDCC